SGLDSATKPALERHIARIVEVGAGSGALSIAIARSVKSARIIATDISQDALKIAARNVADFGLQERIELVRAPFLGDIDMSGVDLVFSNPPYIAASYALPRNVAFEPISALVGGEKGSEVLEELIARCARARVKWLVCEMGYDQKPIMQQVLSLHGYKAEFYKDLAGLHRGFIAYL
ncbi:N5-glutamine methyltransferase family protein, partial [Helicobacter sp. 'CLO3_human']